MTKDHIIVVLKITEQCNLNCSYCYFFNMDNQDFSDKPALITDETLQQVAGFLANAAAQYQAKTVTIVLHGGEPLLIKKNRFEEMIDLFRFQIKPYAELYFYLQTNAVLLDNEWLELVKIKNVFLGISIDGLEQDHDLFRRDKQNRPTHKIVVEKIELARALLTDEDSRSGFGGLYVINPDANAQATYDFFVNNLELNNLHYVLPDFWHDNIEKAKLNQVNTYLLDLFSAWTALNGGNNVKIRFLDTAIKSLIGGRRYITDQLALQNNTVAITIRSDGEIAVEDQYRNVRPDLFNLGMNVENSTLPVFFETPAIQEFLTEIQSLPDDCQGCCFKNVCRGGNFLDAVHRFKSGRGFNNPSIYCEAYRNLFTHAIQYLLDQNVTLERLMEVLYDTNSNTVISV